MPLYYSIPVFLSGLALVLGGSILLSRVLGRLGHCLSIPEPFLGFLAALGADSPEIASAVAAMLSGQSAVGVGVVLGSNLFNLASLLGLPAILAGGIAVRREAVFLSGGVGIFITGVATALVLGKAAPDLALALILLLMAPYAALLALRRSSLLRLPLPGRLRHFVVLAAGESQEHGREIQQTEEEDAVRRRIGKCGPGATAGGDSPASLPKLLAAVFAILAAIVLGSWGLLDSTTWLTENWLSSGLRGTLVLAVLTGIPNLYTAVRLAMSNRGSAVVTEAVNSNSLNILVGLAIPALVFGGLAAHSAGGYLDIGWLMLMTLAVTALLAAGRGLDRARGMAIVAAYIAFVAVRVYLA